MNGGMIVVTVTEASMHHGLGMIIADWISYVPRELMKGEKRGPSMLEMSTGSVHVSPPSGLVI